MYFEIEAHMDNASKLDTCAGNYYGTLQVKRREFDSVAKYLII